MLLIRMFTVQIINMQETSCQIINHVRIMIEETEHASKKAKVSQFFFTIPKHAYILYIYDEYLVRIYFAK